MKLLHLYIWQQFFKTQLDCLLLIFLKKTPCKAVFAQSQCSAACLAECLSIGLTEAWAGRCQWYHPHLIFAVNRFLPAGWQGPDVAWLAGAVHGDIFLMLSLVCDKYTCFRAAVCLQSICTLTSSETKKGDTVGRNLDSSFLGEVGSNSKGSLS